jgi:hypothetical protein
MDDAHGESNTGFASQGLFAPKSQAAMSLIPRSTEVSAKDDVEADITSPTTKLLEIAQAASGSVVQIPADLLVSLLTSIDGLQKQVSMQQVDIMRLGEGNIKLQDDVHGAKGNASALQTYSEIQFSLFPRLPLEIRRMIWDAAASAPRVIPIKFVGDHDIYDYDSVSIIAIGPQHPLLQVSIEARTEALKVQRPLSRKGPTIWANSSVDTIWIPYLDDTFEILDLYADYTKPVPKIASVALHHQYWQDREEPGEEGFFYMINDISKLGTRELILVIGDDEPPSSTNAVIVEPQRGPTKLLSDSWWAEFRSSRVDERTKLAFDENLKWKTLEEEAMNFLRDFQANRAARRKEFLESMFKSNGLRD